MKTHIIAFLLSCVSCSESRHRVCYDHDVGQSCEHDRRNIDADAGVIKKNTLSDLDCENNMCIVIDMRHVNASTR